MVFLLLTLLALSVKAPLLPLLSARQGSLVVVSELAGASQQILSMALPIRSVSFLSEFILLSINLSSVNALNVTSCQTLVVPVVIRLHRYLSGCHLGSCKTTWLF